APPNPVGAFAVDVVRWLTHHAPGATMSLILAAPTVEPLPLPLPAWGVRDAVDALDEARLALRTRLPAPLVISALSTVVLRCGSWVVKVYPPGTDPAHLSRTVTALTGSGSALLPAGQPIVTSA